MRIGNGAWDQKQHDVWGALLDSIYLHTKSRDNLPESVWPIIVKAVECAIDHWKEPDRGIWEVRGDPKHFVSSKVFCWVACDRGARLARVREDSESAKKWQEVADEIHADVCENGVDERGVFTQHYETDALDAALLLMPLVRFLPPDDERVKATVMAICKELTVDGLVLRYKVDETDDGLSGEEGTFAICSFWLVSALSEIGETRHGAGALREDALLHVAAVPVRGGDRPAYRPAPGQLPAGVHPPRADQRRDARDPRRPRADARPAAAGRPPARDRAAARAERRAARRRPEVAVAVRQEDEPAAGGRPDDA